MRAMIMLAAACGFAFLLQAADGQTFPYTATINGQAPFYGQAGEVAPPCGYLAAGSSVEVYKHEGGWLAIRPPVGSFSWVSGAEVQTTAQSDVVQVGAAGTKSWIGHQGNNDRTITQVALSPGEPLKVVGEATLIATGQPLKWYKIAPPPGEFRYVPAQFVGVQPAASVVPSDAVATVPAAQPVVRQVAWTARGNRDSMLAIQPAVSQSAPQVAPVAPPAAKAIQQPIANVSAGQRPSAPQFAQQGFAQSAPSPSSASVQTSFTGNIDPAQQRLDLLEKHINAMIAQPPATWNTMPLSAELQALASTAPSPQSRVRAGELWAKVYQCQQIQSAYTQISSAMHTAAAAQNGSANPWQAGAQSNVAPARYTTASYTKTNSAAPMQLAPEIRALAPRNVIARVRENLRAATEPEALPNQQMAAATPLPQYTPPVTPSVIPTRVDTPPTGEGEPAPTAQTASLTPVNEAKFAGQGWLMPLVNRSQLPLETRAGVPPYALTDGDGNVQYYVTPAPGTNISQYLRQQVGIVGPSNELSSLTSPHITAHRVVILQRHE